MVLIVNTTSDKSITESIRALVPDIEAEYYECSELKISHCIGCNHCWLKTPGECSIKDDYEKILKRMIKADQMWVISDTALGFIDHKGKNFFDRILPILQMYLYFVGDQMRHIPRYDKRTDIGLIVKGECDRKYLERWNGRTTLNIGSNSLGVYSTDELKEAVSCM